MITVTKTTLPPLDKYIKYLNKIWRNNWVTNNGEFVILLENKLKKYLKVKNLSLVSNGTLAMQVAFKALDLTGEVITTSFSFPATSNALIWEGLKPIFVDIDTETFNIDPQKIERRITKKTSAILGVHVFGNPCDVENIDRIARKYKLKVIYDAAHAFGVGYKGKSILNWGDVSTLSFHATKVFHTVEGGAVVGRNKPICRRVNLMRNHGIEEHKYKGSIIVGTNAKMNELQAAMGICLLDTQGEEYLKRERVFNEYVSNFSGNSKVILQQLNPYLTKFNYPYFPLVFSNEKTRDRVYKKLLKKGIFARKYFFPASHELLYLKSKSYNLPITTEISHRILCLPLYGSLPLKDTRRIIEIVNGELK